MEGYGFWFDNIKTNHKKMIEFLKDQCRETYDDLVSFTAFTGSDVPEEMYQNFDGYIDEYIDGIVCYLNEQVIKRHPNANPDTEYFISVFNGNGYLAIVHPKSYWADQSVMNGKECSDILRAFIEYCIIIEYG